MKGQDKGQGRKPEMRLESQRPAFEGSYTEGTEIPAWVSSPWGTTPVGWISLICKVVLSPGMPGRALFRKARKKALSVA